MQFGSGSRELRELQRVREGKAKPMATGNFRELYRADKLARNGLACDGGNYSFRLNIWVLCLFPGLE
jgi:hypothetical protein